MKVFDKWIDFDKVKVFDKGIDFDKVKIFEKVIDLLLFEWKTSWKMRAKELLIHFIFQLTFNLVDQKQLQSFEIPISGFLIQD